MISNETADRILAILQDQPVHGAEFRKKAMEALSELPHYNWSGIYRLENGCLVLDEFVGEATEHTEIAIGVGVCGTAVKESRNILVKDVRKLDNYLACSLQTRSEIVVLIWRGDAVLGQIDIDGHEVGAFDSTDEAFLERLGVQIADRWN